MIGKNIISARPVPLYEVKEILKERTGEAELKYEQNLAYTYAKKFSKISRINGEKLMKELRDAGVGDEQLAVKIVDLLPADLDELRLIIPKGAPFDDAALQEILKIIKKYRKK